MQFGTNVGNSTSRVLHSGLRMRHRRRLHPKLFDEVWRTDVCPHHALPQSDLPALLTRDVPSKLPIACGYSPVARCLGDPLGNRHIAEISARLARSRARIARRAAIARTV
jgi:hypothetical protein